MFDKAKTVCFSDHRKMTFEETQEIEKGLELQNRECVKKGQNTFITGGALGFDTHALCSICTNIAAIPAIRYSVQKIRFRIFADISTTPV